MNTIATHRPAVLSLLLALGASTLPLTTTSCSTPGGRNAFAGGLGGAAIGGLIGGRRGAVAGAITGGIIGLAATPDYRRGYYPRRPGPNAYNNYR